MTNASPDCSFAGILDIASVFSPHGSCILWHPWLMAALIFGSSLFVVAYTWIPITYLRVIRKYSSVGKNPEYRRVYVWTAAFIALCMLTHTVFIITLFFGGVWYYIEAVILILGGVVSLYTAWRVVPTLLTILSQRETAMNELVQELRGDSDLAKRLAKVDRHIEILSALQAERN